MFSYSNVAAVNTKTGSGPPALASSSVDRNITINFLFDCIKAHLGTQTPERVQAIVSQSIDWPYLLEVAKSYGMVPILYNSLQNICPDAVPPVVLARLKQRSAAIAQRNLALISELIKLLQWLDQQGIPAVPFKGPILAASAYGDTALRQFVDLDILIHKKDALKIKQLMLADGYEQVSHIATNDAYEALYLAAACEYNLYRRDRQVAVEPHWGIIPDKFCIPLEPDCLWQRLEKISVAGRTLPTFSSEDTLLIICINGMKDHWENFKTVCDVAALVCNTSINWETVLLRSRQLGCQRILFVGLNLAHTMLNVSLPEDVLQQMQTDSTTQHLTTQFSKRLLDVTSTECDDDHFGSSFSIWHLKIRERKRDKIGYVWHLIFQPTEAEAKTVALPPSLYWAYPLVRVFRLLLRLYNSCWSR